VNDEAYDVVVVGGGFAGVAAAYTAGLRGARTLLVERESALGGNVSNAWVHTICGLFFNDRPEPEYLHAGFPKQFARRVIARGAGRAPERAGRVFVVPTYPELIGGVCDDLCREIDGLRVWTDAQVRAVELAQTPGAITRLTVEHDGAAVDVTARVAIDTTGDGALAALGGAELLPAGPQALQAPALIFRLRSVDDSALRGFSPLRITSSIAGAVHGGVLPGGCDSVLVRPGRAPGLVYVTMNLAPIAGSEYRPLAADYMNDLMTIARERAEQVVAFLCATRPEFARTTLEAWPRRVGVRETRRIAGQHVISEADVADGVHSSHDVALSGWPIELWSDYRRARFTYPSGPCGIPLGALRSRSHPELGMAGRCVSASSAALGALRVLGTALAMGEAIGTAAAIAAAERCSLRAVTSHEIRHRFEEDSHDVYPRYHPAG
jgi:hypothetical protein